MRFTNTELTRDFKHNDKYVSDDRSKQPYAKAVSWVIQQKDDSCHD